MEHPSTQWNEEGGVSRSDPFRMLFVTETWPPETNGVARTALRLVDGLAARGHDVHVVRPRQGPDDYVHTDHSETLVAGIPVPFCRDLRVGLPVYDRLRQLMERLQPDVVHVATEGPLGWAAVSAAKRAGIPVSADLHFNYHLYSRYYATEALSSIVLAYLRKFHNRADGTFVPTKKLARDLLTQGVDHLAVVGRGVDATLFSPARRSIALRREWGAHGTAPVVLYAGRLAAEKNLDLALRTFAAIRARVPLARLVLIGDGPLRASVEQREPDAVVLGWRHSRALAECYASADILLFPSLTETFGNVTLDSLASGLAIVAFDYAAAGELMEDGVSGCLVPYADEEAFVAAARALALAPARIARLGAAARRVAEQHPWERAIGAFESYLRYALIEPSQEALPALNVGAAVDPIALISEWRGHVSCATGKCDVPSLPSSGVLSKSSVNV